MNQVMNVCTPRSWREYVAELGVGLLCFLLNGLTLNAQALLTLDEAMSWTLTEHPLAEIATLTESRAPLLARQAQGAYDPQLKGDYERKSYLGKEYYDFGNAGVEWQSPLGLVLGGGYYLPDDGIFINPERNVPEAGQAYLSAKLPLLQGLLTDEARIGVQRAEVAGDRVRQTARVLRNELRYDLTLRYADWAYATRVLAIAIATEALIEQRLANTIGLVANGDKPAIDTLESRVALGNQRLVRAQAAVDLELARRNLAELYWPLLDNENTIPGTALAAMPFALDTTVWVGGHPELRELTLDITDLELERRLAREKEKPKLNVSYSLLGDGLDFGPEYPGDDTPGVLSRAYKIGASLSYPIGNRQARSKTALTELKIQESTAKLTSKRIALVRKAEAYQQAASVYGAQLDEARLLVQQAERLLEAERTLFQLGESTQFLLNSREQSLQKARLTLAKLAFSYAKAVTTYRFVTATG